MATVRIFVGTQRKPWHEFYSQLTARGPAVVVCSCSAHLWSQQAVYDHYLLGHFDAPVYADVDPVEVAAKREELKEAK